MTTTRSGTSAGRLELPADVKAIALDANSMPGGRLNIGSLKDIVQIARDIGDIEIWLPEPVLWEWAEHAASPLADAMEIYRIAAVRAHKAGIQTMHPGTITRQACIREVISAVEKIGSPLRILRLSDNQVAATLAIKDQVLAYPPARKKHGIKTGAADSATVRLIHDAGDQDVRCYAIASSDGDITKAYKELADDPPLLLKDLQSVRRTLVHYEPSSSKYVEELYHLLSAYIEDSDLGSSNDFAGAKDSNLIGSTLDEYQTYVQATSELLHLGPIIGIQDMEIDSRLNTGTAIGFVAGSASVTGWTSGSSGELISESSGEIKVTVKADLVLELHERQIHYLTIETVELIPRFPSRYHNENQALTDLMDFMHSVPALAKLQPEALERLSEINTRFDKTTWSTTMLNQSLQITIDRHPQPNDRWTWAAEFTMDEHKVHVHFLNRDDPTWADEAGVEEPCFVQVAGLDDRDTGSLPFLLQLVTNRVRQGYFR